MDQELSAQSKTSNKALNIAYLALLISFVSLGVTGWMLYKEVNKPKTIDEKVDAFFQQQDQELDKMFAEGAKNDK